jgi:hypothetical protein
MCRGGKHWELSLRAKRGHIARMAQAVGQLARGRGQLARDRRDLLARLLGRDRLGIVIVRWLTRRVHERRTVTPVFHKLSSSPSPAPQA